MFGGVDRDADVAQPAVYVPVQLCNRVRGKPLVPRVSDGCTYSCTPKRYCNPVAPGCTYGCTLIRCGSRELRTQMQGCTNTYLHINIINNNNSPIARIVQMSECLLYLFCFAMISQIYAGEVERAAIPKFWRNRKCQAKIIILFFLLIMLKLII